MPWGALAELLPKIEPRRREDLPPAPIGTVWQQDPSTLEWRLETLEDANDAPELSDERTDVVDALPSDLQVDRDSSESVEGWEFLSDRVSSSSHQTPVFVARAGSVRSINSVEGHQDASSQRTSSVSASFKFQRTTSNSTIDSSDNALGPTGKGVLGVDYVEHVILPTDTLQGICLAYKIHVTRLRRANGFSGNSLSLAPKKLVIPLSKQALRAGFIRVQDTDAKEYKLHAFLAEFPALSLPEARAYLELADWQLKYAVQSAKEDGEWEQQVPAPNSLKAGEIRISKSGDVKFRGAGLGSRSAPIVPKKHEAIPA